MAQDDDRYQRMNLRLPREVYERVQEAAERNGISMNAEVVKRLEAQEGAPPRVLYSTYVAKSVAYALLCKELASRILVTTKDVNDPFMARVLDILREVENDTLGISRDLIDAANEMIKSESE